MGKSKYDDILTKEFLEEEYINKNLAAKTVGLNIGCSAGIVLKFVKKFKLKKTHCKQYCKHCDKITKEYLHKEYITNCRSPHDIAKEMDVDAHIIYTYLKIYGIKQQDRTGQIGPNQRFNNLVTIEVVGKTKNGTFVWLCRCDCGNLTKVSTSQLKNGTIKSCGCNRHKKGEQHHKWKGYGEISGDQWSGIKFCAKNRNINFDIKIEDCWELYLSQNKTCAISGLEIGFADNTASLDRINSDYSYMESNIQWVHKDINKIKFNLQQDKFIGMCALVTNPIKTRYNIPDNIYIHKSFIKSIKHNAKKRDLEYSINTDYLISLYKQQGGACAYTGICITLPISGTMYRSRLFTASLDRIDSKNGYVENNLQWVYRYINVSKRDFSEYRYLELCKMVAEYNK